MKLVDGYGLTMTPKECVRSQGCRWEEVMQSSGIGSQQNPPTYLKKYYCTKSQIDIHISSTCVCFFLCSMLNFHSYAWIATTYSCLILLHKDLLLLRSLHLLQLLLLHPLDCRINRSTRTPNAESLTLEPSRNGRLHRIGLSIIIWNQEEEFSKHNLYICKGLIDGIKSFTFWSRLMDPIHCGIQQSEMHIISIESHISPCIIKSSAILRNKPRLWDVSSPTILMSCLKEARSVLLAKTVSNIQVAIGFFWIFLVDIFSPAHIAAMLALRLFAVGDGALDGTMKLRHRGACTNHRSHISFWSWCCRPHRSNLPGRRHNLLGWESGALGERREVPGTVDRSTSCGRSFVEGGWEKGSRRSCRARVTCTRKPRSCCSIFWWPPKLISPQRFQHLHVPVQILLCFRHPPTMIRVRRIPWSTLVPRSRRFSLRTLPYPPTDHQLSAERKLPAAIAVVPVWHGGGWEIGVLRCHLLGV